MFENKSNGAKSAPQNLPTNNAPASAKQAPKIKEPEDILAGIDKSDEGNNNVKGPAQAEAASKPPVPPAVAPMEKATIKEPFFKQYKKIIIAVVIIIVAVVALVAVGMYAFNLLTASPDPASLPGNTNQATAGTNTNQTANTNQTPINTNVNTAPPTPPLDTDRDGLSDEDEEKYGTNKNEVDTDKDGLTDRDEVKVFKTDPNNPDTDGDTFLDGAEVRAGYDPKGSGELLRIE